MKTICLFIAVTLLSIGLLAQNNSLDFDGTDDYVNFGTNSPLYSNTTLTVEAWIKTTTTTNPANILTWGNSSTSSGDNIQIRIQDNKLLYGSNVPSGSWISCLGNTTINNGQWVHIAVVKNNNNVQLYVNGVADGSGTNTNIANVNRMVIGIYYERGDVYNSMAFEGKIDEMRIWNDVRTETEIRQNMYRELPNPAGETNLVAYYKFNETIGISLADSKGSSTGTLTSMTGNEWETSSAMFGPKNCLDFDGSNDYIECGNDASITSFNNFTMEAWVKLDNANDNQKILGKFKDWDNYYILGVVDGKNYSQIKAAGNEINFASGNVPSGVWTHLAVTFSKGNGGANGTCYGYVNGEVVYSKTDVADAAISVNNASYPFRIGLAPWDITAFKVNGQIDEVRIWSTARTASEIRENMMKTLNGNESGLAAYYTFDNTTGNKLQDFSGNGNDGTLTNMANDDWVTSSAFNTWLNTNSTAWSTASNWSNGVPVSTDNVGIYNLDAEPNISGSPTFNNLYVGSGVSTTLGSGITVNASLILDKDLDLNSQTITLGSSATLIEDDGVFSGSSGSITTTRSLNNINENVAGLGAKITTTADLGSTTITRTHNSVSGYNFNSSVLRQYSITPTTTTGLNATLEFNYLDSELNGLKEMTLQLIKSTDGGSTWSEQGGVVSTANNTVTLSGIDGFSAWGVTQLIQPMNNYTLDFDGSDDYVECGNNASITEFNNLTVEAWVKLENANDNQKIVGKFKYTNFNDFYVMGVLNGEYHFEIATGDYNNRLTFSAGNVPSNTWTHLAVTFSKGNGGANGTFYGYVNGELVYSKTDVADAAISVSDASYPLRIGVAPWNVNDFKVDGQIDEVRIWNTSRTATEIRENMCRTLDGDENGLVAYYRFNETSGTTAYDATANGNNGTVIGGATWANSESFTTWLGGTSNDWSTATNWTDGVPTSTDNVGIYNWSATAPTISGTPSMQNLIVGPNTSPTVSSNFSVSGNLIVQSNLALGDYTADLGSTGQLIEAGGLLCACTGHSDFCASLDNISCLNIGGLGATISCSANMGNTTVKRYHNPIAGDGSNQSIKRYYVIEPANNSNLNATLVFHYDDTELNGNDENDLVLYKSEDGLSWLPVVGGVLNTTDNTITLSGINDFSWWTAAKSGTILPVSLLKFEGIYQGAEVSLEWSTATEINARNFVIQKSENGIDFSDLQFIPASGNSNQIINYRTTDSEVKNGQIYYYQLIETDFDGTIQKLGIISVLCAGPSGFEIIEKIYPNPVQNLLYFQLNNNYSCSINLLNSLGETLQKIEVKDGVELQYVDMNQYPSGLYYLEVISSDTKQMVKFVK